MTKWSILLHSEGVPALCWFPNHREATEFPLPARRGAAALRNFSRMAVLFKAGAGIPVSIVPWV